MGRTCRGICQLHEAEQIPNALRYEIGQKRCIPFVESSFQVMMYAVLVAKQSYAQNQEAKEEVISSISEI